MLLRKTQLALHTHVPKVREPSGKAIAGSQDASNGVLEKSVNSTSPGRVWVWFPSMHDLETHYVRILGAQPFPRLSRELWYNCSEY